MDFHSSSNCEAGRLQQTAEDAKAEWIKIPNVLHVILVQTLPFLG